MNQLKPRDSYSACSTLPYSTPNLPYDGGLVWFYGGLEWFGVFWGGLGCFNGPTSDDKNGRWRAKSACKMSKLR